MSFYSKKNYDIIVFDNKGKIQGSGNRNSMLKLARKYNYAVAKLIPLRYSKDEGGKK